MHVHAGACMAVLTFHGCVHMHMHILCMMTKHCGWHDDEASQLISGFDFPAKKWRQEKMFFWRENFGGKKV